jgi:hypothetical protein
MRCDRLQNFDLDVDGRIVIFEAQKIEIFLPGDGKIECRGRVLLKEMGNTRLLGYTAIARPRTHSQPAMLESFNCTEGEGISIEVVTAFMQKVKQLMNIPYFKWEHTAFTIKEIEVQKGNLILMIEVQMKQMPSSSTLTAVRGFKFPGSKTGKFCVGVKSPDALYETLRERGLANASLIQNLITNYELRITNYLISP